MKLIPECTHATNERYSIHDQLPAPLPSESIYLSRHFYNNTVRHLVKDFVKIMSNGLHIDLSQVANLETTLDNQLNNIADIFLNNNTIKNFQQIQHKKLINEYKEDRLSKLKNKDYFIKPFDYKNMVHRSYFMYIYCLKQNISAPSVTLPGTSIPKWESKLVKLLSASRPILQTLLEGTLPLTNKIVIEAMDLLATTKMDLYNKKYYEAVTDTSSIELPKFNPASPKQKQELFEWLGVKSETTSKTTGAPSWDRDQVELLNKISVDKDIIEITQAMIDYSFAAIVRNNFIEAFYRYTVNSRLYGGLKIFGAKSLTN